MAVNVPDLSGDDATVRSGIPGGPTVTPTTPAAVVAATNPQAPQKLLQQRWRPESFQDLHLALGIDPAKAPRAAQSMRALDAAIQRSWQITATLENMISCTQFGQATVTGSLLSVPTGLAKVNDATGVIDRGATAHNFTLTITPSAQPGCIDIYVWQPTAAGNTTPIACTTAVTVRWSARGSLS